MSKKQTQTMDDSDATLVWAGTASPKSQAQTTGFGMPSVNKEEKTANDSIRYDAWDEDTAHAQGPSSPTAISPQNASTTDMNKHKNGKQKMSKRPSRIDDFQHNASLLSMDDGGVSHGDPYA